MTPSEKRFVLPLPPSPNELDRGVSRGHHTSKKNAAKRNCFFRAVEQHAPMSDPPEKVRLWAHFFVHNLRDEDNLYASMKLILDSLRLPRKGENFAWKNGIAERKGYITDDDPAHLELGEVSQQLDRSDPRVVVVVEGVA